MTNMEPEERFDRIERQQEFLAASQAQHDARMTEISALLAQNSRQTEENTRQIGQLGDLTLRIGRIVEEQAIRMDKMVESQARTDQRLNVLINVVERYFSNGHR